MQRRGLATTVSVLLLAGCATTRVAQSWTAPDYQGGKLKKVLVVGMTSDPAMKGVFEDGMVTLLGEQGVQAVAAHSVIPQGGKPTKEQLQEAVKEGGFQEVLVTRPAGVDERTEYVPGGPMPYGGFYDYYMGFYPMAYDPGYFTTTRTYKIVTNIYNAETNKLIWSATSESQDPSNRTSAAEAVEKTMVKRLEKDGLV